MLDVREALQKLRGRVTQETLATEIGVSQQTISIWARDGVPPRFELPLRTLQVLEKYLAALDGQPDSVTDDGHPATAE